MGLVRLYLLVSLVYLLMGSQFSNAEIIRKLQKASFQTLFLSTESLGQESNYFGQFLGPSDTEAKFDGDKLISFQNELQRGDTTEFEAHMRNSHSNYNSWLTLQSNSTEETLLVMLNYNYANRSQTMFIENSCEIGIEKIESTYQTEYIGTTKNCGYHDVVREFFIVGLNVNNTKKVVNLASRYPYSTETIHDKYLKYVDTYKSKDKDVYYVILKWPMMKKDGVTFDSVRFELWVNEKDAFMGDAIAGVRIWKFNIV